MRNVTNEYRIIRNTATVVTIKTQAGQASSRCSTRGSGASFGRYGTPHALSWSHEQLVGHTCRPRAASCELSFQTPATNAGSVGATLASKFQNAAAPTRPRGQIMPPIERAKAASACQATTSTARIY